MEDIQSGAVGLDAVRHVAMEHKTVIVHAQIHDLHTVGNDAQGLIDKHGHV